MKTFVLCSRGIIIKHTFDVIGDNIAKVHEDYSLAPNKITRTVTDEGSNFVKAFKVFDQDECETYCESGHSKSFL